MTCLRPCSHVLLSNSMHGSYVHSIMSVYLRQIGYARIFTDFPQASCEVKCLPVACVPRFSESSAAHPHFHLLHNRYN